MSRAASLVMAGITGRKPADYFCNDQKRRKS
jgi:hypothetical protein